MAGSSYPDGMTRDDLIAVGEIEGPREPFPALVLRAVVWITYPAATDEMMQYEDAAPMDEVQSTYSAELAIQRALEATGDTGSGVLKYRTATIDVVDAAYLTPAEADAYDPEHAAYLRGLADGRAGTMTIEEKRRLAAMLGAATREARAAVESEFGTAKADEVVARTEDAARTAAAMVPCPTCEGTGGGYVRTGVQANEWDAEKCLTCKGTGLVAGAPVEGGAS